jgi:hypothetical protein
MFYRPWTKADEIACVGLLLLAILLLLAPFILGTWRYIE